MDVYEAVRTRKSVRSFDQREIPEETLTRILDTARLAPSANNRQEWRFVMVRDPATRIELARLAGGQQFVGEASAVLACCAVETSKVMHCGQAAYPIDTAIVIDHITLLAAAEGLGTCWIGHFDEEGVKTLLRIPDAVRVPALLPIGYPVDPSPASKNRLPLNTLVMRETWHS